MKKYNLLKVIAITIIATWILTLCIPGSSVDYTGNIASKAVSANGIVGLFSNISISISYFSTIGLFLIAIACLYAVLSKVKPYQRFVEKATGIFNGKERSLVIIAILFFSILSLFVNDFLILLVFVPLVYQIMNKLQIDKKTILASIFVSSVVGAICSVYNESLFSVFSLEIKSLLLVKAIVFLLSLFVLILFIAPKRIKNTKNNAKKETVKKTVKEEKGGKLVNKSLYALLTLLLGSIGVNKFYAGKIKEGIVRLLFCWTFIPTVLSIAEFICVLTQKADKNGKINVDSNKNQNVIFGTLFVTLVVVIITAIIPWASLFPKATIFTNINNALNSFVLGSYKVFASLVASSASSMNAQDVFNVVGPWDIGNLTVILFILTFVVTLVTSEYKNEKNNILNIILLVISAIVTVILMALKVEVFSMILLAITIILLLIFIMSSINTNKYIEDINGGIKKILPISVTVTLVSLVLVMTVTSGVNITIVNKIISLTKDFNIATGAIGTLFGSVLTAEYYYFVNTIGALFATVFNSSAYLTVIAFLLNAIYYVAMIIAPTSVGLIIGLYYLDIPFNKWIKYIWKVLLSILAIVLITSIILFILV